MKLDSLLHADFQKFSGGTTPDPSHEGRPPPVPLNNAVESLARESTRHPLRGPRLDLHGCPGTWIDKTGSSQPHAAQQLLYTIRAEPRCISPDADRNSAAVFVLEQ